jgi:hypothetical protein
VEIQGIVGLLIGLCVSFDRCPDLMSARLASDGRLAYKLECESNVSAVNDFVRNLPVRSLPILHPIDRAIQGQISDQIESDNPDDQAQGLTAMAAIFEKEDHLLDQDMLVLILSLARSPVPAVFEAAIEAIRLIMSFPSPMPTFLLHEGVLDLIIDRFPTTLLALENLSLGSPECRDAVLRSPVLEQVWGLLASDDQVTEVANLMGALTYSHFDVPFDFSDFLEFFTAFLVALVGKYDPEKPEVCASIVTASCDFIQADERFMEFFVSQDYLGRFLGSPVPGPEWQMPVLRLLIAFCEYNLHDHVREQAGLEWRRV